MSTIDVKKDPSTPLVTSTQLHVLPKLGRDTDTPKHNLKEVLLVQYQLFNLFT